MDQTNGNPAAAQDQLGADQPFQIVITVAQGKAMEIKRPPDAIRTLGYLQAASAYISAQIWGLAKPADGLIHLPPGSKLAQ